jgi:hypothetical protein
VSTSLPEVPADALLPPAAWRPDPHQPGWLRYWDGTRWTDHVAPDPHEAAAAPPRVPAPEPRRPYTATTGRVGVAALVALGLVAAVDAAAIVVDVWAASVVSGWIDDPETARVEQGDQIDALTRGLGLAHMALYVAVAVVLITWLYRVYVSDRVDPAELRHSSGWVIGAWFVPILSWWRPLQVVRDLWWSATPAPQRGRGAAGRRSIPWLMVWWWAAWIVTNVSGYLSLQVRQRVDEANGLLASLQFDAFADGVSVVAALLAIGVFGGLARKVSTPATA